MKKQHLHRQKCPDTHIIVTKSALCFYYNSSMYLLEMYQCLKSQTYSSWEWIVVDDCSTDNSWEILEKLKTQNALERKKYVSKAPLETL